MSSITLSLFRSSDVADATRQLERERYAIERITVRICLPIMQGEAREETNALWASLSTLPKLQELSIQLNGKALSTISVDHLVVTLDGFRECGSKVVSLMMNSLWIDGNMHQLLHCLEQHFTGLKTLHLWQTQAVNQDSGVAPLLNLTSRLEEFKLESCSISKVTPASDVAMETVAQSKTLKKLTLDDCQNSEALALLSALNESQTTSHLKVLSFGDSKLQTPAVRSIGRLLLNPQCRLETISLTLLEHVSILPIVEALQTENTTLKRLCFCRLQKNTSDPPEQDVRALRTVLADSNTTLQEVDISVKESHSTYNEDVEDPEIDFYLTLNCLGRGKLLEDINKNDVGAATSPEFWISNVLTSPDFQDEVSYIYYWLSKCPWLCQV
jgi:hypothetical protein